MWSTVMTWVWVCSTEIYFLTQLTADLRQWSGPLLCVPWRHCLSASSSKSAIHIPVLILNFLTFLLPQLQVPQTYDILVIPMYCALKSKSEFMWRQRGQNNISVMFPHVHEEWHMTEHISKLLYRSIKGLQIQLRGKKYESYRLKTGQELPLLRERRPCDSVW